MELRAVRWSGGTTCKSRSHQGRGSIRCGPFILAAGESEDAPSAKAGQSGNRRSRDSDCRRHPQPASESTTGTRAAGVDLEPGCPSTTPAAFDSPHRGVTPAPSRSETTTKRTQTEASGVLRLKRAMAAFMSTLPRSVRGRAATRTHCFGIANGGTLKRRAATRSDGWASPTRRATTRSPHSGSGIPRTATSDTPR